MNKISASILAGLFVLGLAACSADPSQGRTQIDRPPVITTDTPTTVAPDRGCPSPHRPHIACAR